MKVLLFANTEWYLYNFRLALARRLRSRGVEVLLVSPPGPYADRLRNEGFRWAQVPLKRRSLNPFTEVWSLWHLIRLYRRETPTIVHHFTIKCVVYGSLAARIAGIGNRVNAVAGLGYVFSSGQTLATLLRPFVRILIRIALRGPHTRLILQNSGDRAVLERAKLVDGDHVRLIRGSGVNTARFRPRAKPRSDPARFRVILAARLLWDKGIGEYVQAARRLREAGLDIEFLLAGSPDPGNPSSIEMETVKEWNEQGLVTVVGHMNDMDRLLHEVDAAVLPSYYGEGIPRSLIEAASCGLPIVATDTPGCRDVVEHGRTGLLVPIRDAGALAAAIQYLYEHAPERKTMGAAGRIKALHEFDEEVVLERTMDVYRELAPDICWDNPSR